MRSRHDEVQDEDDNMVVPPGGSVRVGLLVMDSLQKAVAFDARNHQPHFAQVSDQERELKARTRAQFLKTLQDAWRSPGRDATPEPDDDPDDPTEPDDDDDTDDQARRTYLRELQSAWRTPPRMITGFGPDTVAGPNLSIAGAGPRDAKNARDAADAAWHEMRDKLSSAWRSGR